MDVPMIARAMAAKIATVPGIKGSRYPVPDRIDRTPFVLLYWGSPDTRTRIENDMRGRMWLVPIRAEILIARLGDTPAEIAEADALVTPIVDLFDIGPASSVLSGLDGHVDRCQVTTLETSVEITYAGHKHYGAVIEWQVKFHRRPGG